MEASNPYTTPSTSPNPDAAPDPVESLATPTPFAQPGTPGNPVQEKSAARDRSVEAENLMKGDGAASPATQRPITDPITMQRLAAIDQRDDLRLGSYTRNGEVFVYADADSLNKANGWEVKSLINDARHAVGMPMAGIERYGSTEVIRDTDAVDPAPLIKARRVFRVVYKLTNPI